MIIYKDVLNGDEMFTDIYKVEVVHDGFLYKVHGKFVTEKVADVGAINIGGNKSAEEPEGDDYGDDTVSGVNICLHSNLSKTAFPNRKAYGVYIKPYMKRVKEYLIKNHDEETAAEFERVAKTVVPTQILKKYDELEFYVGNTMDADAMVPFCIWEDVVVNDTVDNVPMMYFFKHGILAEKV